MDIEFNFKGEPLGGEITNCESVNYACISVPMPCPVCQYLSFMELPKAYFSIHGMLWIQVKERLELW